MHRIITSFLHKIHQITLTPLVLRLFNRSRETFALILTYRSTFHISLSQATYFYHWIFIHLFKKTHGQIDSKMQQLRFGIRVHTFTIQKHKKKFHVHLLFTSKNYSYSQKVSKWAKEHHAPPNLNQTVSSLLNKIRKVTNMEQAWSTHEVKIWTKEHSWNK